MKRIIIELSDEQHDKMKAHQSKGAEINGNQIAFQDVVLNYAVVKLEIGLK